MTDPTPTSSGRRFRPAEFGTLAEALDYAATCETGITVHDGRGAVSERLAYRDLAARARALARRLLAAGLAPGGRVGLVASTDAGFITAFFACQYAGLLPAPLPLPAAFGGRDAYLAQIRGMAGAARLDALLGPEWLAGWMDEAARGLGLGPVGTVAEAEAQPEPDIDLPAPPDADSLAYVQFSSGSTRFPKGVAVTHRAVTSNAAAIIRHGLRIGPGDRCTSWLPLYHDMGLVGFLLVPVLAQLSLDLLPTSEFARRPLLWPTLISRNRGTLSFSPSFGYDLCQRRARRAGAEGLDLSCWRAAGVGGDMVRPGILSRFAEAFAPHGFAPEAFVPSYGMAEATLALSFAPLGQGVAAETLDIDRLERTGEAAPPAAAGARARDFVLCGPVLPGHGLEVRDPVGRALPEGRVGRIHVRGPSLMKGYLDRAGDTATVLGPGGWMDTGDLGYLRRGQVVITGRAKDLIIVHGRNVSPQDLEWTAEREVVALRNGDVAAVSVDDAAGERVLLLVQCRLTGPDEREGLRREVQGTVRRLHGLEAEVVLLPHNALPVTSSGKLSRNRARRLYLEGAFGTAPAP